MEMPKVDANHEKLHAMVGQWEGEEIMHPSPWDPEGGKSIGKITAAMELGGFFLISNYEQIRGDVTTFRGHGVYGYDANEKKHTMHWFDTMGGDPGAPAMGVWDGDVMSFSNHHKFGYGRYTYEFKSDGVYTFKMEASQDGENWAPMMDSTYRRV